MSDTRKTPTLEPLPDLPADYDPARAEHIRELVESMRASNDPLERDRLADELSLFIFGSAR